MGYIAKCAVEIQNIESAKMMWKYLDKYSKPKHCTNRRYLFDVGALQIQELDCPCNRLSYIDCLAYTPNKTEEEAVKLFLELAQMDDDDVSTLWFEMKQPKETNGTHWVETTYHKDWSSSSELIEAVCENWVTTLSPLEVAQAFKESKIELLW